MLVLGAIVIILTFWGDNDYCFLASQILVFLGMTVATMELYFRVDNTKKMIFKSIIFMMVLGILIVICRKELAKYNVITVIIIFNLIALIINLIDKLISKLYTRSNKKG